MNSISTIIAALCLISVTSGFENWDDLIDNQLLGSGNFLHAAAFSLDGNSQKISPGFKVKNEEVSGIISTFGSNVNYQRPLLRVAGVDYTTVLATDEIVSGKDVDGEGGVIAVRTSGILIIGVYDKRNAIAALDTIELVENSLREEVY